MFDLEKNKNGFEMPWPRAIKCPPNWNFMKVLEKRKKIAEPYSAYIYLYITYQYTLQWRWPPDHKFYFVGSVTKGLKYDENKSGADSHFKTLNLRYRKTKPDFF